MGTIKVKAPFFQKKMPDLLLPVSGLVTSNNSGPDCRLDAERSSAKFVVAK